MSENERSVRRLIVSEFVGDRSWRQLLDRHDRVVRAEVGRWRGAFVKSTGDGILATFDAPTRALRCAFGLAEALTGLGLRIRAAIHTGEVEMRGDDIGGIGVHIAARALAEAGAGGSTKGLGWCQRRRAAVVLTARPKSGAYGSVGAEAMRDGRVPRSPTMRATVSRQ